MNLAKWDERIQRADELAVAHPFAADVLRFYHRVATWQKGLYSCLQQSAVTDFNALAPRFSEFLDEIESAAPEPLAQCAREWKNRDALELLDSHWRSVLP